jgi:hypothetical protein
VGLQRKQAGQSANTRRLSRTAGSTERERWSRRIAASKPHTRWPAHPGSSPQLEPQSPLSKAGIFGASPPKVHPVLVCRGETAQTATIELSRRFARTGVRTVFLFTRCCEQQHREHIGSWRWLEQTQRRCRSNKHYHHQKIMHWELVTFSTDHSVAAGYTSTATIRSKPPEHHGGCSRLWVPDSSTEFQTFRQHVNGYENQSRACMSALLC